MQFILPIIPIILIITIPPPTPPIVPIHADSASGWTSQSIVGSITLQLRDKQTKQKHIKYAKTKKRKQNSQPRDGQVRPLWDPLHSISKTNKQNNTKYAQTKTKIPPEKEVAPPI